MGDRVYIGGTFTYVGRYTGSGVPLSAATGAPVPRFARVDGSVDTAISDGAGGYFVASSVTPVRGARRAYLVHVRADGSLDRAWNPLPNNRVLALEVSGSTVYAGGDFTQIGDQPRDHIAALDATTGAVTAWNPDASGLGEPFSKTVVGALAVSGSTVYVGGNFARIGGEPRHDVAALDAATGAATPWSPGAEGLVGTLAVSGSTIYAGGQFSEIGGRRRNYIAALDAATGAVTAWNPDASSYVYELVVSGSTVYAVGDFSEIGGKPRSWLAGLDATTGAATAFNPRPGSYVQTVAVSGSTVYAGGRFNEIGGRKRNYIAALNSATGAATAWNPNAGDGVDALAASGSTVYAGGTFTSIGGVSRNHIAALDAHTGALTAWNPDADEYVDALAGSGSTVYVGGGFSSIGGRRRNTIAALSTRTGLATAWNPNADSWVVPLAVAGPVVYAGGPFNSIGGRARSGFAQLDASTGAATPWNAHSRWFTTSGHVDAIAIHGSTLYVAGLFDHIGGQARTNIAALNAITGAATPWNPNPRYLDRDGDVYTLALEGSTVYVGGHFTRIGGKARNYIAALNSATGAATAWDPHATCTALQVEHGVCGVSALTISGARVYAGGVFISIGNRVRHAIAELDASSGLATSWNPHATSYSQTGPEVHALAVLGSRLYVGGLFDSMGGHPHQGFAAFRQPRVPQLI